VKACIVICVVWMFQHLFCVDLPTMSVCCLGFGGGRSFSGLFVFVVCVCAHLNAIIDVALVVDDIRVGIVGHERTTAGFLRRGQRL
jgi:hypothetical protein